jgi:LPS export ABC transporter protein LptC
MNRFISLSIFLFIAVIAWWSITDNYSEINRFKPAKGKRYAEIFMNEFEITTMGDNGKPSYILNGKRLERYNNSDDTRIQQPVFHLLQENAQWKVNADSAIVNDINETIQLTNNVVMQQQNIEPAVIIHAQNLLVHTKTQIVQTQAPVDITQGKSRLKSNGMIFNNVTGELELSSNVNGYYLPYD